MAPDRPIRIWIIVNNKLRSDPEVVRSRWTSIAGRSLSALLRTSTLQTIRDTELLARLIDQRPEFDATMRFVSIPDDYVIEESEEMFDGESMRKLIELDRKMGADPDSWRTRSLRPGASFDQE